MPDFIEVARTDELKDGTMKLVTVGGQELLLARTGGKYYAANGHCPHMGGKLWEGQLDGTIVTCPRHGSRFDLSNGRVVRWTNWTGITLALAKIARSPRPLQTYEVKVQGNNVMVAAGQKATAGKTA